MAAAGAQDVGVDEAGRLVVARVRGKEGVGEAAPGALRVVVEGGMERVARGWVSAGWSFVGRSAAQKGGTGGKTPMRPGVVEEYSWVGGSGGGAGSWVRIGRCPSWYGGGQCMMNLRSVRVSGGRKGLDEEMRRWMAEEGRGRPLAADDFGKALDAQKAGEPRRRKKFLGIF